MRMKSKILVAIAGVLTLFSVCLEAAFLFSKDELKAKEVSEGPCWFIEQSSRSIYRNCGKQSSIKEITISNRLGEFQLDVRFDQENSKARYDLITFGRKYGIKFDLEWRIRLEIEDRKGLSLEGNAEEVQIVLSLINEMEPLSKEVIERISNFVMEYAEQDTCGPV